MGDLVDINFFESLSKWAIVRFFRSFEALNSFSVGCPEGPFQMFDFFGVLGSSTIVDGTPRRVLLQLGQGGRLQSGQPGLDCSLPVCLELGSLTIVDGTPRRVLLQLGQGGRLQSGQPGLD